ncbi:heparinase II/III family protein [Vibrio owensii]|uniref:heparinase II/III family protein n=1 Tax=Vibrio owensii TaxID=696485 RepID=UPI002FEEF976
MKVIRNVGKLARDLAITYRDIEVKDFFNSSLRKIVLERDNIILPDEYIKNILSYKFNILSNDVVSFQPSGEVNWNSDPYSGYTWNKNWHKFCNRNRPTNSDIKVPWEFGRLQFLIPLYLHLSSIGKVNDFYTYLFNLLNSFKKENPVAFSVQWSCAMDVGIRAVNLCLLLLFLRGDRLLSEERKNRLEKIIVKLVYKHKLFIENNFEWNNGDRNNHYLCNLMGVLVSSCILSEHDHNQIKDAKLYINKIIDEIEYQFNLDGSNFECSTNYHRLSSEVVYLSLLFSVEYKLLSKKKIKFIESKWELIYKFSIDLIKNVSLPVNIGDTDSGYIISLIPDFLILNDSVVVDHNFLSKYIFSLDGRIDSVISCFSQYINDDDNQPKYMVSERAKFRLLSEISNQTIIKSSKIKKTAVNYYESFGVIKVEFNESYIIIKISGENNSGHKHVDYLKTEIYIDGVYYSKFKGTFSYAGSLAYRNKMRCLHENISLDLHKKFQTLPECYANLHEVVNVNKNVDGFILTVDVNMKDQFLSIKLKDNEVIFNSNTDCFMRDIEYYPSYGVKREFILC